jgi:putative dehydrogenase
MALGAAQSGAAQSGAAAALRAELASSQPDILRMLDRGVPGMFDKAYRWVAEMEEICAFLGDLPAAKIYRGAARLYEAIAADQASPKPDGMVARLETFYRGAKKDASIG